jgi:hypothetical protein
VRIEDNDEQIHPYVATQNYVKELNKIWYSEACNKMFYFCSVLFISVHNVKYDPYCIQKSEMRICQLYNNDSSYKILVKGKVVTVFN